MMKITDEILMQKLQNKDIQSLGILYDRYKNLIFNYFLRCTGDYDVSNDLVMETFERIYKYRNSFNETKKVRPWIFQIASNLVKNYYKSSARVKQINEEKIENQYSYEENLNFDTEYKNQQLYKALNTLSSSQKNIINMYYLLEMSYQEIANSESISVNNARIKVCRALKKLNGLLKRVEL